MTAPFINGYRLPGHERAALSVTVRSLQMITYAQLPEPFQCAQHSDEEFIGEQMTGDTPVATAFPIRHEGMIEFKDCMDGNYSALLQSLSQNALEAAGTVAQGMLGVLDRFLSAAGQTVRSAPGASILDIFLDGLDKTMMQFDKDGKPDFSACYMVRSGPEGISHVGYAFLLDRLVREGTDEQNRRYLSIVERQKRERDSRQRHF